jgi:hypothetical protein
MADSAEYVTLPTALRLVTSKIADNDLARSRRTLRDRYDAMGFFYPEASQSSRDPYAKFNKESNDRWSKQELAIVRFQSAIVKDQIETCVRDPASGALFTLEQGDWREAAFREEIIRGGIVRASACERLEQYRGWPTLTKTGSVRRWLATEKRRRPAADESKCQAWLFAGMLASPYQKIKAKREWRIEATQLFGVSVRAFNRAWSSAVEASGSTWDLSGAPHKWSQ